MRLETVALQELLITYLVSLWFWLLASFYSIFAWINCGSSILPKPHPKYFQFATRDSQALLNCSFSYLKDAE